MTLKVSWHSGHSVCAGQCPQPPAPMDLCAPTFPWMRCGCAATRTFPGRCLKQSQPEFWGSLISLLGCRRRKGCCLPASSEGLLLFGAMNRRKGRRRDSALAFPAPSCPACCAKGTGAPCLLHFLGLLVFSQETATQSTSVPPLAPTRPLSGSSVEILQCHAWRLPGCHKTAVDLVGGRKKKQTMNFYV